MSQSLAQVCLHLVFSTKHRFSFLVDDVLRSEMHRYLGGACHNLECPPLAIGGVEDHVHILCRLSRTLSISTFVGELKRECSKWVKTTDPTNRVLRDFHWQDGYGAFSVGRSEVEDVRSYIHSQPEHHRHESFQVEFRRMLAMYDVERYVWD